MLNDLNGAYFLHQVYTAAQPHYSGRGTVPIRWDKTAAALLSIMNLSEIIRMLTNAFDAVGATSGDYYPVDLRGHIDAVNRASLRRLQMASTRPALRPVRLPMTMRSPACSEMLDSA